MIQATQTKTIDPKATPVAKEVGNKKGLDALLTGETESKVEGQEFAAELKASLGEDAKVKPTELTAEQLLQLQAQPGMIQEEQEAGAEVNPKVFDPSMTKGVEKLIQPKTTAVPSQNVDLNQLQTQNIKLTDAQVLQLSNGEIQAVQNEVSQAMLKTPQVSAAEGGRSPAIDFAKGEVDPQLMNMEDFVAQKNLVNKKTLPQGYGIHPKPEIHKHALENGLKTTQTINETNAAEGAAVGGAAVGSQQFILNMMNEQQGSPRVADAQAPQKVFDMSQIKTDNPNQIMNQISDYIVQAKASKEPTVSMRVNHEELGMIDITVSKAGAPGVNADAVAINIGAHSSDGKNFFQQNSKDLFSHLSQVGVNVSDLKVETAQNSSKNEFDMNQHNNRQGSQGERHFGSEQNQRRHDSNRRQELWDLLNKEAA